MFYNIVIPSGNTSLLPQARNWAQTDAGDLPLPTHHLVAEFSTVLVSSMQLSGITVTFQKSPSWASNIFIIVDIFIEKGLIIHS